MDRAAEPRRPGEFELIAKLFAPLARAPGAFSLTDDVALATPPAGYDLAVTTDALVAGVHFLPADPPDLVARKALRVNLSDLAAKGCTPVGYLLALSIPATLGMLWLEAFADGLKQDQDAFGLSLLGGDTVSTPGPLTLAITALGHVPSGAMLRRSGARPGDLVFVSGTVGDADGGLACLKGNDASVAEWEREFLIRRFQLPDPHLALGQALLGVASAAIDVSDGLLADLGHIAAASKVRIAIDAERVPISPALASFSPQTAERAVRAAAAGDDYEIAFTVPAEKFDRALEASERTGVPIRVTGRVEPGAGVALLDKRGEEMAVTSFGYKHF